MANPTAPGSAASSAQLAGSRIDTLSRDERREGASASIFGGSATLDRGELRVDARFEASESLECVILGTTIAIAAGALIHAGARVALAGGSLRLGAGARIGRFAEVVVRRCVELGPDAAIEDWVQIESEGGDIALGGAARVGRFSRIWAHSGPVRIGSACTLGHGNTWIGTGEGIHVADGCDFTHQVTLDSAGGRIEIGPNSGVGPGSVLYGHGGLRIGTHCAIAGLTMLVPGNHRFDRADRAIREQGVEPLPILVDDDVWIGGGVVVLGGAAIGRGAVVAAGAVVRGAIDPGAVVAGVPARTIKRRPSQAPASQP